MNPRALGQRRHLHRARHARAGWATRSGAHHYAARQPLSERSWAPCGATTSTGLIWTAAMVLEQWPDWFADYNGVAPHSVLGFRSPWQYRSRMTSPRKTTATQNWSRRA